MEWKKIRGWLIILVLAVDLFLAGNLVLQALRAQQTLRQAAQNAVTIAQGRGVEISLETVLALPAEMTVYQTQRSEALEQAAAQALLGENITRESSGGGVSYYRSGEGEMAFRRGGALEMTGPWTWAEFNARECSEALENAGFDLKDAAVETGNGAVELTQGCEGLPVFNSRIVCLYEENGLQVRGRWMLADQLTADGVGLSRAQMVLALCDLLEARQVTLAGTVQAGYYLQSEDAQSLTLEPVWAVETDQGQLILSCVNGEQLNF